MLHAAPIDINFDPNRVKQTNKGRTPAFRINHKESMNNATPEGMVGNTAHPNSSFYKTGDP